MQPCGFRSIHNTYITRIHTCMHTTYTYLACPVATVWIKGRIYIHTLHTYMYAYILHIHTSRAQWPLCGFRSIHTSTQVHTLHTYILHIHVHTSRAQWPLCGFRSLFLTRDSIVLASLLLCISCCMYVCKHACIYVDRDPRFGGLHSFVWHVCACVYVCSCMLLCLVAKNCDATHAYTYR
jgi:hypothetical protein